MKRRHSVGDSDAELARALVQAQDLGARLMAECSRARCEAERAKSKAMELEGSIAFRLGSLLLAVRSPRGLVALPGALARLIRHWRERGRNDVPFVAQPEAVASAAFDLPGAEVARRWHLSRRPPLPESLGGLRIAAVVDEFTEACFAPDCRLLNLAVSGVGRQLDEFQPHLLLVESAWRGRAGGWKHKVCPCSSELRYLVDACRRRGIPTVFWSKEDPSHFDDFIEAAALFDHVFTTDSDCIERYRERLGHGRVGFLGFSCQPAMHNPVEVRPRAAAASFAGSWYARYPERARDFESLVGAVQQALPVEIYDRNHDRDDPAFSYPEKYRPLIRAGVPYGRIAEVYKSCEFAITVNTIKGSPTMFARRVFELLACNTIAISNRSIGIDLAFGDIVVMAERDDVEWRLVELRDSEDARHRLRLRGLREVMGRHRSEIRLAQIADAVVGRVTIEEPRVWVLARVPSIEVLERVVEMFVAQEWKRKELLLLAQEGVGDGGALPDGVRLVPANLAIADLVPEGEWVSPWHTDDYYGPCYLLDMMHATRFVDAPVIGKSTVFRVENGVPRLARGDKPYSADGKLITRCSIFGMEGIAGRTCLEIADAAEVESASVVGAVVDEFSYCMAGAKKPDAVLVDVNGCGQGQGAEWP